MQSPCSVYYFVAEEGEGHFADVNNDGLIFVEYWNQVHFLVILDILMPYVYSFISFLN